MVMQHSSAVLRRTRLHRAMREGGRKGGWERRTHKTRSRRAAELHRCRCMGTPSRRSQSVND
jgi:hypothetical protein